MVCCALELQDHRLTPLGKKLIASKDESGVTHAEQEHRHG